MSKLLHEFGRTWLRRQAIHGYLKLPLSLRRDHGMPVLGDWLYDIDAFPPHLQIEPASSCNLNCPFCLVGTQNEHSAAHSDIQRPVGVLHPELFHKILADAREMDFKRVSLYFQGEPFLNKHLVEYVRATVESGYQCTISTNGTLMNRAVLEALGQIPMATLRFSVDGATPETYALNRVGGDFEVVLANLRYARELCHPRTSVEWQFIVMRNNEHEIPLAREMAKEIGVPIVFKTFAATVPDLVPRDTKYQRKPLPKPCQTVRYMMGIYADGVVVPCCYDVEGKRVMGNVNRSSLKDIWMSEHYRNFRRKVLNVDDEDIEICQNCLRWRSPDYGAAESKNGSPDKPGHDSLIEV